MAMRSCLMAPAGDSSYWSAMTNWRHAWRRGGRTGRQRNIPVAITGSTSSTSARLIAAVTWTFSWAPAAAPSNGNRTDVRGMKPHDILPAGNLLGEGVLWDWRRGRLWWTDIQGRRLHCYDWSSGRLEGLPAPGRIGSFGLVAGSERLITAFADGIALYD